MAQPTQLQADNSNTILFYYLLENSIVLALTCTFWHRRYWTAAFSPEPKESILKARKRNKTPSSSPLLLWALGESCSVEGGKHTFSLADWQVKPLWKVHRNFPSGGDNEDVYLPALGLQKASSNNNYKHYPMTWLCWASFHRKRTWRNCCPSQWSKSNWNSLSSQNRTLYGAQKLISTQQSNPTNSTKRYLPTTLCKCLRSARDLLLASPNFLACSIVPIRTFHLVLEGKFISPIRSLQPLKGLRWMGNIPIGISFRQKKKPTMHVGVLHLHSTLLSQGTDQQGQVLISCVGRACAIHNSYAIIQRVGVCPLSAIVIENWTQKGKEDSICISFWFCRLKIT